jgi:phytoene/squalene synthetase
MTLQSDIFLEIFDTIDFEKIKDHPNILIAANFWDEDRYGAARTCYKLMRTIDDLVDNYKTEHTIITDKEKKVLVTNVENWINSIVSQSENNPSYKDIIETFHRFCIPSWPMEAFAKSMIYDINNEGFPSLQGFLDYSQGASVAPASIFVHLCGIRKVDGQYVSPSYDVREAAIPCAVFSYIVHIIRDFRKDQLNNLNYFADDIIAKNGLDRKRINEMAHGAGIEDGFRNMISEYYAVADIYRLKTYEKIAEIRPFLEPRYQLSLDIIFNLYLMIFERIDAKKGGFTSEELNPTTEEVRKRVYDTIIGFKPD